jgi:diacylglycerol kinase family enzyme
VLNYKPLHVVINKNSGTVLRLGEERVSNIIREKLGARLHSLRLLEPSQMCEVLEKLVRSKSGDILIGGGDGSATCAAEILQDSSETHLGVLPLGTMNFLAQDLGSAPTFEESMERFQGFYSDTIDIGVVNDRLFLCNAVVGLVPESAVAREEIRETGALEAMARLITTITRGMGGSVEQQLSLQQDGEDRPIALKTTSLIISNNRFIQRPEDMSARFARDTLKDGHLAVYSAAPKDIIDGLRLLMKMWQGQWQEDETVVSFETSSLIVNSEEKETLVSLDGEPVSLQSPLKFKLKRQALPVLRMDLAA